jgi:hypothetical protein
MIQSKVYFCSIISNNSNDTLEGERINHIFPYICLIRILLAWSVT